MSICVRQKDRGGKESKYRSQGNQRSTVSWEVGFAFSPKTS